AQRASAAPLLSESRARSKREENPLTACAALWLPLKEELQKPFAARVVTLWPRQSSPDGDLIRDEMERVMQVPGWKNVTTQPIINRIEMLSTGVRNDVGVKVFGRDPATVDHVSKEIAATLEPIKGAQGVLAWQIR